MTTDMLASGVTVSIRKLQPSDLPAISQFEYSASITEPHSDPARLAEIFNVSGMWLEESGAVAMIENDSQRFIGTLQFYRSAPCIHGLEIGYVVHSASDRGKSYATQALGLFSNLLFSIRPKFFRQQLLIEVWNTASWKVAENSGFVREGILRSCGFGEGDPADCFIYSRTQKDYLQAKASTNGPG